jgi:hypothetical protein
MGLFIGRTPMFEYETLFLSSPHLVGGRVADGCQVSLLGELFAITPVLNLSHATGSDQQQRHHADQRQLQCAGAHGTSLKNT